MPTKTTKYAIVLAFSTLLLMGLVAGGNALVDPFGMYRWLDLEGFNAAKPAIYHRVRLLKAYEVRRLRPDSVVLGSSRVHLGVRPGHPGWSKRFDRPYNLGFDGAMTKEMYHYLVHAHAAGHLRHVMLGLDSYHLSDVPGLGLRKPKVSQEGSHVLDRSLPKLPWSRKPLDQPIVGPQILGLLGHSRKDQKDQVKHRVGRVVVVRLPIDRSQPLL